MIKITNGIAIIEKKLKLKKKHLNNLKKLSKEDDKENYIKSLFGLSKETVRELFRSRLGEPTYNPTSFKSILSSISDLSANKNHSPIIKKSTSRWIGVEIECLIDGNSNDHCDGEHDCNNCDGSGRVSLEDDACNSYEFNCRECYGSGSIDCDGDCGCDNNEPAVYEELRHDLKLAGVRRASVRADGSVYNDNDQIGVEITLLFDTSNGFSQLEKLCEVLKKYNASVTNRCGLHVHLNASDLQDIDAVKRKGMRFEKYLPFLSTLVPQSRLENDFCKLSVSDTSGHHRYHAINLNSWHKRRTIEIRLHSGTTNFWKIKNWITLLQTIYSLPKTPSQDVSTFDAAVKSLKLSQELVKFFRSRVKKFQGEQGESVQESA